MKWRQLLCNVQIKTAFSKIGKLCNEIDVGSIEGKQLDLCKGNTIFCLQENRKMKEKYFVLPILRRLSQQ